MKASYFILFLLIIALIFSSYILFFKITEFNSNPVILEQKNITPNENIISYPYGELQYYPNMRFNHNNITYSIDSSCSEEKIKRIEKAISMLEEDVNEISFFYTNNNADIEIICENKNVPSEVKEYFIAGEGGPTSVINTSLFYIIEKGKILLYNDKSSCDHPNVELHELLHVFGFEHSTNKESIMYSVSSCKQVLTEDIKNELKRLYSIENLPELYFSEIDVKKHGSYIDFELKIKNQGLVKAKNIKLRIISTFSNNTIDEFDMGDIEYGEGKYLKVENLKIPFRTKDIKFEIVNGKELNNNNDVAEFSIE